MDRPNEHLPELSANDRRFLFTVVKRIVRDDATADDLTQDAMLRAYRHRDTFRGESSYRTWLFRIATTTAMSHLRREHRRGRYMVGPDAGPDLESIPSRDSDAAEQLGTHEQACALTSALRALPDKYRDVLLLRFGDGMSERDTAVALGLSVPNVKVRAHRARRMLERTAALSAARDVTPSFDASSHAMLRAA